VGVAQIAYRVTVRRSGRPLPNIPLWRGPDGHAHMLADAPNGGSARVIPDRRYHLQ